MLGGGANVIVRDEGYAGVGHPPQRDRGSSKPRSKATSVCAGAAVDLPKLVRETLKRGLVGFEVLAGIPGTVGGTVRMNAGGRYGEIGDFVCEVRILGTKGDIRTLAANEVGFTYRHTDLRECVVMDVMFELAHGDAETAHRRYREIWNEKYAAQPPLAARTSGCIFKNPPETSAGRLIDEAGLKGTRIGGAVISDKTRQLHRRRR